VQGSEHTLTFLKGRKRRLASSEKFSPENWFDHAWCDRRGVPLAVLLLGRRLERASTT